MHHLLDMVFDGGRVGDDSADPTHAGSTVIDLSAQPGRTFKVLRPGAGCEAARSALSSHGLHEESNETERAYESDCCEDRRDACMHSIEDSH
jgi:hypothetical protein